MTLGKRVSNLLGHGVLNDYQFGFRKHHSTSLALIDVVDSIYSHLDLDEIVMGIYVDLYKAFDTFNHDILLYKLYNYGVRGSVFSWFKDYLTNRQQFVSVSNAESKNTIACGVPQGSVLDHCYLLFMSMTSSI